MSKWHARQWEIVEAVERPDPAAVAALREFPTTQIADCGGPVGVVGPGIVPLAGGRELCGPAVTVWTRPGDILYPLKAVDLLTAGDVLVIDGGGRPDAALIGDFVAASAAGAGCAGIVVDGAVRDLDGIDEAAVATFARNAHPATGSVAGPGAINVAVQIGGVAVQPGDVVRADSSGIVVVPREHLASVLELTRAVAERESGWQAAVAAGATLPAAAGIDALIAELTGPDATPEPSG
jgi:4-hydroxy-4-methyl-2-oxoglutarate aldolase